MFKKIKGAKVVHAWIFVGICLFSASLIIAQSTKIYNQVNYAGFGTYLNVSLALLFTFLTFFVITLLARHLRETSGNSFNGFDDPDC